MKKQLFLGLTLIMILLSGCATNVQNDTQPFPPDVVAEV